jgi:hypothetical protein
MFVIVKKVQREVDRIREIHRAVSDVRSREITKATLASETLVDFSTVLVFELNVQNSELTDKTLFESTCWHLSQETRED